MNDDEDEESELVLVAKAVQAAQDAYYKMLEQDRLDASFFPIEIKVIKLTSEFKPWKMFLHTNDKELPLSNGDTE